MVLRNLSLSIKANFKSLAKSLLIPQRQMRSINGGTVSVLTLKVFVSKNHFAKEFSV